MGQLDPDYISINEISYSVKEHGYLQLGDLWYTFDSENWFAVKTFKTDKDVINMINRSRYEKRTVLNIHVEHAIEEVDIGNPLLTESGVGPSSYRSHDFDEDIGREHREDIGGKHWEDIGEDYEIIEAVMMMRKILGRVVRRRRVMDVETVIGHVEVIIMKVLKIRELRLWYRCKVSSMRQR